MKIQRDEYEALIEKLLDDRLSEDEVPRLNHVLRHSPEARDHYWQLVVLEGYLADLPDWIAGQQYATQLAFPETLEAFLEMESNAEAELQVYPLVTTPIIEEQASSHRASRGDTRVTSGFDSRSKAGKKARKWMAAAAAVGLVALIGVSWLIDQSGKPTPAPPVANQRDAAPSELTTPPSLTTVAVVLNHRGAPLSGHKSTLPSGTPLLQGERVTLLKGTAMQLQYASGAVVILEGPGEFKMLTNYRVGMQYGRIAANVPPQAKGFTISTEETDFIDHGTEFAVTLDEQGRGEVVVMKGLIEARQSDLDTLDPQQQPKSMMLREGVGGRLVPDEALPKSVESIDQFQTDRYARNWDDVIYRPRVSGDIKYVTSPPASVDVGQTTGDTPLLIPERRGVVLTEALHLRSDKANRMVIDKLGLQVAPQEDYVIDAGTKLDSFLIHFEIPPGTREGVTQRDFKIKFQGRIIGIVQDHHSQIYTDTLVGLKSMQYPGSGSLREAFDPPGHPNHDAIHLSGNLQTLSIKMRLSGMDQIRVLVENTDK